MSLRQLAVRVLSGARPHDCPALGHVIITQCVVVPGAWPHGLHACPALGRMFYMLHVCPAFGHIYTLPAPGQARLLLRLRCESTVSRSGCLSRSSGQARSLEQRTLLRQYLLELYLLDHKVLIEHAYELGFFRCRHPRSNCP